MVSNIPKSTLASKGLSGFSGHLHAVAVLLGVELCQQLQASLDLELPVPEHVLLHHGHGILVIIRSAAERLLGPQLGSVGNDQAFLGHGVISNFTRTGDGCGKTDALISQSIILVHPVIDGPPCWHALHPAYLS